MIEINYVEKFWIVFIRVVAWLCSEYFIINFDIQLIISRQLYVRFSIF